MSKIYKGVDYVLDKINDIINFINLVCQGPWSDTKHLFDYATSLGK